MARLRKISGNYYLYFRDTNRQPSEKSVPLRVTMKSAARKFQRRLEEEYAAGTFDPWNDKPRLAALSLSEAARRFLDDHPQHRPNTQEAYRCAFRGLQRHTPPGVMVSDVTSQHVSEYVLNRSVRRATRAKRYRHLLAFFNWCERKSHVKDHPLATLRKPKTPKKIPSYLRVEEVQRLLQTMDEDREAAKSLPGPTPQVQWLKDVVMLAISTGLRRGALATLQWEDIDLQGGRLTVRNREEIGHLTKSGNERSIPIAPDARTVLERLHQNHPEEKPAGAVLHSARGLPLSRYPDRITKRFKHYARMAKLPEYISFHSLRHTCATWLVASGTPPMVIKDIMGHGEMSTTDRYMHNMPGSMDEAMQETFSRLGDA